MKRGRSRSLVGVHAGGLLRGVRLLGDALPQLRIDFLRRRHAALQRRHLRLPVCVPLPLALPPFLQQHVQSLSTNNPDDSTMQLPRGHSTAGPVRHPRLFVSNQTERLPCGTSGF